MSPPTRPNAVARFPRVPPHLAAAHGEWTGALRLRPFPRDREDLDVELDAESDPHAVSAILTRCVARADDQSLDARFLWAMEVGARIECLLRIAALGGAGAFSVRVRCLSATCGEPLELDLTLEELLALRGDQHAPLVADVGGVTRRLRAPTGEDQLAWLANSYDDLDHAARDLAGSLLEERALAPLTDADVEAIERSLSAHDPFVEFFVRVACPHCSTETEHEVDLASLALGKLREARDALIGEIDVLASRYHWTEAEILEIPRRRRARYLALGESGAWSRA
jgi:hypothetical protein